MAISADYNGSSNQLLEREGATEIALKYLPPAMLIALSLIYLTYFSPSLFTSDWNEVMPLMKSGVFFAAPYGGRYFIQPMYWIDQQLFATNLTPLFIVLWL